MIKAPKSRSGKARATQSVEARIAQLEDLHRSGDEILVVWRPPGAPVSKALRNADYGPGDRVVRPRLEKESDPADYSVPPDSSQGVADW
jgi:hypothetical protein